MLNKIILFFLFPVLLACSAVPVKNEINLEEKDIQNEEKPEEDEREPISDRIILKDFYNGEKYPLSTLSMNRPVFMLLTATWCSACKDMVKTMDRLNEYYRNSIFFVAVYLNGDTPEKYQLESIPKMELAESPEELPLESNDIFPRAIIISRNGREIETVLDGILPVLVYHGILGNL